MKMHSSQSSSGNSNENKEKKVNFIINNGDNKSSYIVSCESIEEKSKPEKEAPTKE
jgi:hypothetical protein